MREVIKTSGLGEAARTVWDQIAVRAALLPYPVNIIVMVFIEVIDSILHFV